jgi:hypothetical protein
MCRIFLRMLIQFLFENGNFIMVEVYYSEFMVLFSRTIVNLRYVLNLWIYELILSLENILL